MACPPSRRLRPWEVDTAEPRLFILAGGVTELAELYRTDRGDSISPASGRVVEVVAAALGVGLDCMVKLRAKRR